MAVAFDAASTATTGADAAAYSLDWSHTCAGADRVLFVATASRGAAEAVLAVTYNGVSLTQISSQQNSDAWVIIWRLINPATGANTVHTETDPEGAGLKWVGIAVSYTGANQTDPDGTPVTATGTSNAPGGSVTGVSTDNMIFGAFAAEGTPSISTEGGGQTSRGTVATSAAPNIRGHACDEASAVGSVAITHTISASVDWAWAGVEVLVAAGGDVAETVTGGATPTGSLATAIASPTLTGGVTPSGTETDALGVATAGAITPAGALATPDIAIAQDGAVTPAGAVAEGLDITQAGAVTSAGIVAENLGLTTITGALTPAGDVTQTIGADVAGAVTPTGDAHVSAFTQGTDGAVTPTGDVMGALGFTALGSTSPSGDVGQSIGAQPAGAITPSGSVAVVVTPGPVPPTPTSAPTPTADDQGVIFVSDGWPYAEAPREIAVKVQQPIEVWRRGDVTPSGRVTVDVDQSPLYRKQAQDLMLMGVL